MTVKLKITAIKPYPVWVGIRNQMLVKIRPWHLHFHSECRRPRS